MDLCLFWEEILRHVDLYENYRLDWLLKVVISDLIVLVRSKIWSAHYHFIIPIHLQLEASVKAKGGPQCIKYDYWYFHFLLYEIWGKIRLEEFLSVAGDDVFTFACFFIFLRVCFQLRKFTLIVCQQLSFEEENWIFLASKQTTTLTFLLVYSFGIPIEDCYKYGEHTEI